MPNFSLIFAVAVVLNAALSFRSSDYYKKINGSRGGDGATAEDDTASKKEWSRLLKKYLTVYLLATLSDWLQGKTFACFLFAPIGVSSPHYFVLSSSLKDRTCTLCMQIMAIRSMISLSYSLQVSGRQ